MPRARVVACFTALLLLLAPLRANAQIPITPVPLTKAGSEVVTVSLKQAGTPEKPELPLDVLTRKYQTGDWRSTQLLAAEYVRDISCRDEFFDVRGSAAPPCANGHRGLDLTTDHVVLIWLGRDFKGEPALFSVLIPESLRDPFKTYAPGIARAYQFFITDQPGATLAARYLSTETENPLIGQVPAVVTAGLGPLFGVLAKAAPAVETQRALPSRDIGGGRPDAPPPAPPPPPIKHYVRLATVDLPMRRSQTKADFQATIPARRDLFGKDAEALSAKLQFTDVYASDCGKTLAAALAAETTAIAEKELACSADGGDEAACRAAFDRRFKEAAARVKTSCNAQQADAASMTSVDKKFRELVDGVKGTKAGGDFTLTNAPLTHLSFGALTSLTFSGSLKSPRVKLDNSGKYSADPLARQLSMIVVNVAVHGYQAASQRITPAQRFRPFAGFVVQPDFGVAGGLSVLVVKGIGINVGLAFLAIPSAEAGKNIGEAPSKPTDPFRLGRARVGFIGASYNFGK